MPTVDGHDYEAADTLVVADPVQHRAMADPFRTQLVQLLRDLIRQQRMDPSCAAITN